MAVCGPCANWCWAWGLHRSPRQLQPDQKQQEDNAEFRKHRDAVDIGKGDVAEPGGLRNKSTKAVRSDGHARDQKTQDRTDPCMLEKRHEDGRNGEKDYDFAKKRYSGFVWHQTNSGWRYRIGIIPVESSAVIVIGQSRPVFHINCAFVTVRSPMGQGFK